MPIASDAKSGLFKLLKLLPHNGIGVWIMHRMGGDASSALPGHYASRTVRIPRSDGAGSIRTLVIAPKERTGPLPLVVHYHGGGHVMGAPEGSSLDRIANLITARDAIFVCPDYRLATEAAFPAGFNDSYDALLWAAENVEALGGRADQIIIGGESAGGGQTLSVALKARDDGKVKIAFMMPIYPMADDREANWTDVPRAETSWTVKLNRFGWDKLLGPGRRGTADVTAYEAPARATDWSGLPPTLTFIGTLDIFLEETRAIVNGLKAARVAVDYREFADVYHGQEVFAPDATGSLAIKEHYRKTFATFVDTYRAPQS